jgi:hypothetical protein
MATIAERLDRIADLELARARLWHRLRDADQALREAHEDLRDAMIVAARSPETAAVVARLPTVAELAVAASTEPPLTVQ